MTTLDEGRALVDRAMADIGADHDAAAILRRANHDGAEREIRTLAPRPPSARVLEQAGIKTDADLGYDVLAKLRAALIADPFEALLFMDNPVRVRDYIARDDQYRGGSYLLGTGMEAMHASDIAGAVAEDALNNWQLRQAGGSSPN